MDSGVHPILHLKFHHQLSYSKLNLKIEYASLYYRCEVWNYNKSETDLINHSIESFDLVEIILRQKMFMSK